MKMSKNTLEVLLQKKSSKRPNKTWIWLMTCSPILMTIRVMNMISHKLTLLRILILTLQTSIWWIHSLDILLKNSVKSVFSRTLRPNLSIWSKRMTKKSTKWSYSRNNNECRRYWKDNSARSNRWFRLYKLHLVRVMGWVYMETLPAKAVEID